MASILRAGGAGNPGRVIAGPGDLAEGAAHLAVVEPRFADAIARAGPPPLRRQAGGFAALARIVAGQQISAAAAGAIVARLEAAGLTRAEGAHAAGEAGLRAAGLSRPKARALAAIAAAPPDFDALAAMDDDGVVATLTALPGIGRWSAEIYLLFALGRADAFACGDLALRVAAQHLFDLPARPAPVALDEMARAWSPWRGVAARVLWAYYRVCTGREGVIRDGPGDAPKGT